MSRFLRVIHRIRFVQMLHKGTQLPALIFHEQMDMGIHQAESEDGYIIIPQDGVYAVHPPDEVGFIVKD